MDLHVNLDKSGQTLVTLLVFMVIAIAITSSAVVLTISNSLQASKVEQGTIALQIAESGAENALLRLLRNPGYTGETLTVGIGTAIITVTGTPVKIVSEGINGRFRRKIEVGVNTSTTLTVTSWKEIY
jgi:hypothetical protein